MTSAAADLSALHAIVPVRQPAAAKTRLGLALDAEEREVLALGLLLRTLDVLTAWPACRSVSVVSDDRLLVEGVRRARPGLAALLEPNASGLNGALVAARETAIASGATAVLMLPADLPHLSVAALDSIADAADAAIAAGAGRPVVVLAPADARRGTNALLVTPPLTIDPHFGEASLEAHLRAAAAAEASVQLVIDPAFGFDLDTPEDLERLDIDRQLELQQLGELFRSRLERGGSHGPAPATPAEAI